jgi:hypothetical protein
MSNYKLNSKIQVALNQWVRILDKEMNISADLRKTDRVEQAEMMIKKLEGMMT